MAKPVRLPSKARTPRKATGQPKKKRVDRESPEQRIAFEYMRVVHPSAFRVAFHVPNGGKRDEITAAKLKREGVRPGVPDIHVALARGGYFGLWIEMKAKPPHNAAVSPNQKEWIEKLTFEGYRVVMCKGYGEFKKAIDEYMGLPPTLRRVEHCVKDGHFA